jgi:hypothetical protein
MRDQAQKDLIYVVYVNLPRHEFISNPQHGNAEQAATDASGQKMKGFLSWSCLRLVICRELSDAKFGDGISHR